MFNEKERQVYRKKYIDRYTAVNSGFISTDEPYMAINHGISPSTAGKYKDRLDLLFGWNGDIRNLSKEMAYWIYENEVWHYLSLDRVMEYSEELVELMFKWSTKAAGHRPISSLQESMNLLNKGRFGFKKIPSDGKFGKKTITLLNKMIHEYANVDIINILIYLLHCDYLMWIKNIAIARPDDMVSDFNVAEVELTIRQMSRVLSTGTILNH